LFIGESSLLFVGRAVVLEWKPSGGAQVGFQASYVRWMLAVFFCLGLATAAMAQKEHRQTLTEAQVEKIREAGIYPNIRIKLYTDFLDERAERINGLTNQGRARGRAQRLDNELQDFTALLDELGSNLDQYGDRKSDMRQALKRLNELAPKWLAILKALPGEPAFDEARKEAIEADQDTVDQAKRLMSEQETYFAEHKKAKDQEREEPQ
jgi:hypothetical protein